MASKQTINYGLSQWEATDQVLRADFNADNAKIDAALKVAQDAAERPNFAMGVLTDYDGTAAVTVDLGQQPKMVMVGSKIGFTNVVSPDGDYLSSGHAVAMPGMVGYFSYMPALEVTKGVALTVTETGFTLEKGMNPSFAPYFYLALL